MDPVRSAVDDERFRFARDVHDILGPSLTTIRVKAELAGKLLDVDLERARSEIHELECLSRTAIAQVHEAVQGYREIDLVEELRRARTALTAAGVSVDLPSVPADLPAVPPDLTGLFAWAVREGVTNVIRHSHASRCSVSLAPDRLEVRDDGTAAPDHPVGGFGLLGLRERAAEVGASVVTRHLDPGFSLAVVRG